MDEARALGRLEAQRVEQRVDMALGVGAALDRETGRLVDDNRPIVAIEHGVAQQRGILRPQARHGRGGWWRLRQRRHPDRLAGRNGIAGAGSLAVDADLAGAQQLFELAVAEPGIVPPEPAVEPPRAVFRPHRYGFDAGHCPVAARRRSLSQ